MRHVQSGVMSTAANANANAVHIFICIWRGVVVWLLLATCDRRIYGSVKAAKGGDEEGEEVEADEELVHWVLVVLVGVGGAVQPRTCRR
ncbi:hypothetical protein ACLKA6_015049 [Drosophila palustris]